MALDATNALGGTSAAATSKASKKNDNSPEAIQERFMALLVAQLKNQDPLAPMDNAQVTGQMAQLNTVTGIQNLNTTMENMASSFASNQAVQATGMLGRTVLTDGANVSLAGGSAAGALEMKQTADAVTVKIVNSAGNTIRTLDMGALDKGIHEFNWDGKDDSGSTVVNGTYSFQVEAKAAGQSAEAYGLTKTVVQGVRNTGAGGATLLTSVGTEVSFKDIRQIF